MKKILGWSCMIISIFAFLYLVFTNLDMTPQRLFITYWYFYLCIIVVTIFGYFMIEK